MKRRRRRRRAFGMPLLVKELVEQAARRRTYIVRVVYAILLFLGFGLFFYQRMKWMGWNPLQMLGSGRELFMILMALQFTGVYIFLPAMMSGVLTLEKERDSLGLLFLTDLTGNEILSQKFLGRLVPMGTFMLLSLPLMAIAYSFGGITSTHVYAGIYMLFLACLQTGAAALMFSAFCRTTAQAFIGTYLFGAALFLTLPLLDEMRIIYTNNDFNFALFPPYIFFDLSSGTGMRWWRIVWRSLPIWCTIVLFLALSRAFLHTRAFLTPKNQVLRLFKALDKVMQEWNKHVGNILLVKDRGSLPDDEPVAWREMSKKALGKIHYLFRVFVLVEVPVVLVATGVLGNTRSWRWGGNSEELSVVLIVLWIVTALLLTVLGANAIVHERTRQTLDVLLTTPMTGEEILKQKLRGLRRLMLVLLVPFLTLIIAEAWWEAGGHWYSSSWRLGTLPYLHASLLSVFIYMPMLVWISLWIGLKIRTRSRAILAAVIAVAGWIILPVLILVIIKDVFDLNGLGDEICRMLLLLSPATVPVLTTFGELPRLFRNLGGPWTAIFINFTFYGGILWFVRRRCLDRADIYLGRVTPEHRTRPAFTPSVAARERQLRTRLPAKPDQNPD